MLWIGGVWDARMNHRLVGFLGLVALFLVAAAGAAINGVYLFRVIF